MSLRERILAINDLRLEPVEVPEWGVTVWITMLGLADRLEYERWVSQQPEDSNETVIRLLVLSMTDGSGAKIFTDADAKDLLGKNPDVLLRLGKIAARVNRLGEAEVTATKGES